MMQKPRKNLFSAALPFLLLLVHSICIYLLYLQVPLNSDHANQVLQAADILNGNVLLKGWNLTGVSFYLSELVFYVFGTALAGIDTQAYLIAASSMVILLSWLGFFLAYDGEKSLKQAFFYLALTGLPTLTWLGYLRGHCAIFIYFFLLLFCFRRIFRDDKSGIMPWIAFGLLTACGCMSDMQLLIIGILPICLFCILNQVRNEPRFSPRKSRCLMLLALCGTAAGMGMDALLMKAGEINKNAFLDTRKFADLDQLGAKFLLFGKGILNVFRVDFPLTRRGYAALAAAVLILGLTVYFIIRTLWRFLRNGDGDHVSIVLSLSLTLMMGVCFFTDIYTAEDSARYIAYFPFAAGALICRNLPVRKWRIPTVCFLILIAVFFRPFSLTRVETPQDRLAVFLEENGLTYGYSDFWNASHTTVAANDQVKVRAIRTQVPELGKPDYFEMQNWFCKTSWYGEYANFIVFDGSNYLHVSEENALILLGEPDQVLDTGEYRIYVYDRDLSSEIVRR